MIKNLFIYTCAFMCLLIFWSCSRIKTSEGFIEIDGAEIYYKVSNPGKNRINKSLVFIHGGPGLDHTTFLPSLSSVPGYPLVFYDQRGCGRSEGRINLGKLTINVLIQDLEALRGRLKLKKLSLVAYGFGAVIALDYSLAYPGHVEKLFFISPMGLSYTFEENFQERINARLTQGEVENIRTWENDLMSSSLDTLDIAITEIYRLRLPHQFYNPEKASLMNFHEFSNLAAMGFFYSIDFKRLRNESSRVTVPMMIVYGADDPYPEEAYVEYASFFPQAEIRKIPQCGHFPFIEYPERIKKIIGKFFG